MTASLIACLCFIVFLFGLVGGIVFALVYFGNPGAIQDAWDQGYAAGHRDRLNGPQRKDSAE